MARPKYREMERRTVSTEPLTPHSTHLRQNVRLPASSRVSNSETRTFVLWITPFNEGLGLVGL